MRKLYDDKTANAPRLNTDKLFADYGNDYKYKGIIDDAVRFICDKQLYKTELWERFVNQFNVRWDADRGWRGEFWGKMMRGACLVYSYTKDESLYNILTETVRKMLATQDEYGRISSYPVHCEFDGWDMWCRKYVLLGMQYYLEICKDNALKDEIIDSMKAQVDYLISKIGKREDGKKPINETTNFWRGLNASSILEPIVRLYSLTGEQKYLDFASYIVSEGGTCVGNIFELAYKDEIYPYQYPMTKAYEMISCFEGVLEYYRVTGDEKYKSAVINFANKVIESDFTVIGSGGCTHELFDHSTVRQANTTNGPTAQETCVTVTYMKFFYQLLLLTGQAKYADAFERSLYNAYLGSLNTEGKCDNWIKENYSSWCLEPLPFDSYSPLTAGRRGVSTGGLMYMSDNHFYGCCACIGSAGIGMVPKVQLLTKEKGMAVALYINGVAESTTPSGKPLKIITDTKYPAEGKIKMSFCLQEDENFVISVRNPEWSKTTSIKVNGESIDVNCGFVDIDRVWKNGDTVEISLDMTTVLIHPIPYEDQMIMTNVHWKYNYVTAVYDKQDPEALKHYAMRRGPIMLARDSRLGIDADEAVSLDTSSDTVNAEVIDKNNIPYDCTVAVSVKLKDGKDLVLTDYASAGRLYSKESALAAWMRTK